MRSGSFADRLLEAVERKRSHVVVGLDPDIRLIPPTFRARYGIGDAPGDYATDVEPVVACYRAYLSKVVYGLADDVVAVKPQIAYFEALGAPGYALYEEMVRLASDAGLLVIADVKRGDIGSTAEAYAHAHLDLAGADAVTLNPYFGSDGLEPFLERCRTAGKGAFVLVKTSNPSSAEIQDITTRSGFAVHEHVADLVKIWGADSVGARGYSSVGAVVGATHPHQVVALRARASGVPLLLPGYGAQGATAADLAGVFDRQGTGAVVNSARAILYAYRTRRGDWLAAARAEALEMKGALWAAAGRE